MLKFALLFATVLVSQLALADQISGDYRKGDQHDVFISKVSDRTDTYFVTIFTVGGDEKACYFQEEMKLASGGLVFANVTCQVGVTKDSANSVKVVGSCPQHCTNGMSIEDSGLVKAAETEPIKAAEENIGD